MSCDCKIVPGEPCAIKPLVWRDHRPDSFPEPAWSAHTPFGFYNIEEVSASDSPAYVVRLHAHHFIADKDGLEEAKAAAQADYEHRIRSALSTPSDAVNESAEAAQWPANLHPLTLDLVKRFAVALAEKLCLAEEKYGYSDNWQRDDWKDDCQHKLIKHIAKGDPRDVAAYCAFMWHHGWTTILLDSDELAGCREVLREATVKNAKQAAIIVDLNDMVLRYAYRVETNASAEARLREAADAIQQLDPLAIKALESHQRQLDQDGVEVGVSRQAVDEIVAAVKSMRAALSPPSGGKQK